MKDKNPAVTKKKRDSYSRSKSMRWISPDPAKRTYFLPGSGMPPDLRASEHSRRHALDEVKELSGMKPEEKLTFPLSPESSMHPGSPEPQATPATSSPEVESIPKKRPPVPGSREDKELGVKNGIYVPTINGQYLKPVTHGVANVTVKGVEYVRQEIVAMAPRAIQVLQEILDDESASPKLRADVAVRIVEHVIGRPVSPLAMMGGDIMKKKSFDEMTDAEIQHLLALAATQAGAVVEEPKDGEGAVTEVAPRLIEGEGEH